MTCVVCELPLSGRQTRYCSRTCSIRATNARQAGTPQRKEIQRRKSARHRGSTPKPRVTEFICGWCDTRRTPGTDAAANANRFCGPQCKALWHTHKASRREVRWERATAKLYRNSVTGSLTFVGGSCLRCGDTFVIPPWQVSGPCCGAKCNATEAKRRRRGRETGYKLTARRKAAIFERDHWTCHICDELVDPLAHHTDDFAPCVDHVVPLSRGGKHHPANMRCAHRWCNAMKSDRLMSEAF